MSWNDEAAGWDDDPAVRAYSAAALGSLREVLDERGVALAGARAFDFGCGTGLLTQAMAAEADAVIAVDIAPAMIDVLQRKQLGNVTALCGDLPQLLADNPAWAGGFDLVTGSSVFAFVDDYPATVARLATLLRPGGLWVQWDWELDPSAEEPMGLRPSDIERALRGAGLQRVVVDVGFELPFEGMVMAPLRGVGTAR